MRKKLRIAALIAGGLLLAAVLGLGGFYWALKRQPEFYRQAIQLDQAVQKQASDRMLQRAAALRSDVEKEGQWQALFTAEQINGWLAVDLLENFPDLLPQSCRDPRVEIQPGGMTLAGRLTRGAETCVVTLTVEPYLPEPNVLAVRIRGARAGLVPMPLNEILDSISEAAEKMDLRLQWQQADGDPVALISVPSPPDQDGPLVQVETIRLGEGEIYVAGTTGPLKPDGTETEK